MIYELRIYTAHPGKMPELQARFRDHTLALFEKHGLKNVGYCTNSIGGNSDELWYMLSFENHAQREAAWASFGADPDWQKARADSEVGGPLVLRITNRILNPTSWSPKP